jgi:hypothetical protein
MLTLVTAAVAIWAQSTDTTAQTYEAQQQQQHKQAPTTAVASTREIKMFATAKQRLLFTY